MTAQKFSSALGQIDARYVDEALQYTAKKRRPWLKWGAMAACACLIVGAFALVPLLRDGGAQSGGTVIDNVLPTDIDSMIWSDSVGTTDDGSGKHLEWNGFLVDSALYEVLRSCSPTQWIAVIMTKADGENIARAEYEQILDAMINRHEQNGKLYLFVTVEELLHWNLENKSDYALRLGDRSDYEGWGAK